GVEVRFASLIAFGLWAGFTLKSSSPAQHHTDLLNCYISHISVTLPPQLLYLLDYSQISFTSQQLQYCRSYAQAIQTYISSTNISPHSKYYPKDLSPSTSQCYTYTSHILCRHISFHSTYRQRKGL
ncbi:hypothetical protein B0H16DRAFT_1499815, partial [Mycena metata]